MDSYDHTYKIGLMIYLKYDWYMKKGGELQNEYIWNIFGSVNLVTQQKNGFHCGVFACMFWDLISSDRLIVFSQDDINNK